jgi:hypothetical protein
LGICGRSLEERSACQQFNGAIKSFATLWSFVHYFLIVLMALSMNTAVIDSQAFNATGYHFAQVTPRAPWPSLADMLCYLDACFAFLHPWYMQ